MKYIRERKKEKILGMGRQKERKIKIKGGKSREEKRRKKEKIFTETIFLSPFVF